MWARQKKKKRGKKNYGRWKNIKIAIFTELIFILFACVYILVYLCADLINLLSAYVHSILQQKQLLPYTPHCNISTHFLVPKIENLFDWESEKKRKKKGGKVSERRLWVIMYHVANEKSITSVVFFLLFLYLFSFLSIYLFLHHPTRVQKQNSLTPYFFSPLLLLFPPATAAVVSVILN